MGKNALFLWLSGCALLAAHGCAEDQFYLRLYSQSPVSVVSDTETVVRVRPQSSGTAELFDDIGVFLHGRSVYAYRREGGWIPSLDRLQFRLDPDTVRIGYMVHAGRRDLPVTLITPRDNVCELRVRSQPERPLGYASIVMGAVLSAFVPLTATDSNPASHSMAPYLAAAGGILALAGTALLRVPPPQEHVLLEQSCYPAPPFKPVPR